MIRSALLASLIFFAAAVVHAADVSIIAPPAARAAMTEAIPPFERQSGHKIVMDYRDAGELLDQAKRDERLDAVIAPVAPMGELARAYRILPDTRRTLGRTAPDADAPQGAVLAIATLKGAEHEDAARSFCAYLALPETVAVLRRNGLARP
jgi:ABC-type molybdate transport system substrate-binding protein